MKTYRSSKANVPETTLPSEHYLCANNFKNLKIFGTY